MTEVALRRRTQTKRPLHQDGGRRRRSTRGAQGGEPMAWIARVRVVEAGAMIAATCLAALTVLGAYEDSLARERVIPGVNLAGQAVGGLGREQLESVARTAAEATLDRPLTLVAGEAEVRTTARALGAVPVPDASIQSALAAGRTGGLLANLRSRVRARRGDVDLAVGYRFQEQRALSQLLELAPAVERPSLPTRLDLKRRRIDPAQRGSALLAYDSLSAVAVGLAGGKDRIDLVVQHKPPVDDPLEGVAAKLDLNVLLGSFDTPYQMDAKHADRTHNLEVGSAAIAGKVLMPGETFSFNDVVGERSAPAGYRYAPGIAGGEMIDVLGGGICQVSSTLFGAGFFAGLEVVSARPHSRPSSYVDMGLDSTVAYPNIDMKLRNGFDFPVVFNMTVKQGKVRAEVLGARRPYQVAFERKITEVLPYRTIWRHDERLQLGTEVVAQRGMRGFTVERTRKLYQGGQLVATESKDLHYPSTTEIKRQGVSPQGAIPKPKTLPPLRDPATHLRIVQ